MKSFRNLKITQKKRLNYENIAKGLYGLALGLSKKVLIADVFGWYVNYGFANIESLNSFEAMFVMLAYTFQIYFDFSGYCDIATSIGHMFNIKIPMNFNSPYKANTIIEFWQRWHMTLTRFLTKYIYIPLGGNRKGLRRLYLNIMIVFIISGFWHGASWTFILWGVMHGLANIFNRLFSKQIDKLPNIMNWLITFSFINLAWVVFRAESLGDVMLFFERLFYGGFEGLANNFYMLTRDIVGYNVISVIQPSINMDMFVMITLFIFSLFAVKKMKNTNERLDEFKPTVAKVIITVILMIACIFSFGGVSEFLYFNF